MTLTLYKACATLYRYQLIFAISVVPFVADFLLISTYPAYMNETADTKQEPYSPNETLALILTSAPTLP